MLHPQHILAGCFSCLGLPLPGHRATSKWAAVTLVETPAARRGDGPVSVFHSPPAAAEVMLGEVPSSQKVAVRTRIDSAASVLSVLALNLRSQAAGTESLGGRFWFSDREKPSFAESGPEQGEFITKCPKVDESARTQGQSQLW